MNKLIFSLGIFFLMVLSSCSNISELERYILVERQEAKRNILIEEFTGQKCINCPEAHSEIKKIEKEYGDSNVITVSIHASALALKPLKTQEGQTYYKHWKGESVPAALINRVGRLVSLTAWAGVINTELQRTTPLELSVEVEPSPDSRDLAIKVQALSSSFLNGNLQLWIVEDSIIAKQLLKDNKQDPRYVHNHVFRGAVNGLWGTNVKLSKEEQGSFEFDYMLDSQWKLDNLFIVAFVYNDEGVVQVIRKKIKPNKKTQS